MGAAEVAEIFDTMTYGPAPESPANARAWIAEHGGQFELFINNEWVPPSGGEYTESVNPYTGEAIARTAQAAESDLERAVKAARKAFEAWSRTPGHVRARYLYAIARHVQKHSRLLAVLESMDNGKPIRESRDIDVPAVVRHFYHHVGWAQLMETELADMAPIGVVGQIVPWNFPFLMIAWKVAPALAMGNTVVLKPASYTRLTALAFAEIVRDVGLPPGVVNVVTGPSKIGQAMVTHPGIDKIAFTGSTEVGRWIREASAGSGKRLSLELGGKSPFIVFEDADLDGAIEGIVDAIWFNQGEVCCAGSRLLVQESIADRFLEKLRARMEKLRVGDALDKGVDVGAIVSRAQWETISRYIEVGVAEGATVWQPACPLPDKGFFLPPTLLTNVEPASTVAQDEIFGPVLVSMTFRTPAEAVALANNTRFGLAASIWTDNVNLALDIARQVKAGTVWVNCTNRFDGASGFGGYRESGYGREGGYEGLFEYVRPAWEVHKPKATKKPAEPTPNGAEAGSPASDGNGAFAWPLIDRTPKLYIGGKQVRPDQGYSRRVLGPNGKNGAAPLVGHVAEGNRKDIRNAVEAAHKAESWAFTTAHNRAQVHYYIGENLAARADEFARRIVQMTGRSMESARAEVEASVARLFSYGAWADKFEGRVHETAFHGLTLATHEPIGVIGVACPDEMPLLGFVSLVAPAVAMGNRVVAIPSEPHPLSATDLYQVLDTSDVPGGVVNIVTGARDLLAKVLAEHNDVDSVWYFGSAEGSKMVELASVGNLKRTWVSYGRSRDWMDPEQGEGRAFLRHAVQVKNIWVPYGE